MFQYIKTCSLLQRAALLNFPDRLPRGFIYVKIHTMENVWNGQPLIWANWHVTGYEKTVTP